MEDILRKHFRGDKIIWYVVAGLSIISMLIIYSATGNLAAKTSTGSAFYFLLRHAIFLFVGVVVIILAHKVQYRWYSRTAFIMLVFAIVLLVVALFSGTKLNDASRWITLPVVGFSFQPSEFAKIAVMIYLARELALYQNEKITLKIYFWRFLFPVLAVIVLIFTEDLSTAALIVLASMVLMFIGRIPFKYLFSTGAIAVGLMILLLSVGRVAPNYVPRRVATWNARIDSFMGWDQKGGKAENSEVEEKDYQTSKAELAIANGGFFGKGPGNSIQKYFLPHPYSDFVYAIIIEELGMAGGIVVLLAYMVLLFRAGVIVRSSKRVFPAFMVIGLTMILVLQAIVNMGVAVGLFPVTGQTLPLVSMGGTSVLFSCLALGMILSVSRYNIEEKQKEEKATNG